MARAAGIKTLLRAGRSFLAAAGLLFLLITFTPLTGWYAAQLARPWQSPEGEVLVVLSAASPNRDVLDVSTYWRCFIAVLEYRAHPYREVLVSGRDSASGMRDFLVAGGVPADRIRMEAQSTTTRENAEFASKMLKGEKGRIVLVTSDIHMFRAYRAFTKAGVKVQAWPAPDYIKRSGSYAARTQLFAGEIDETARILYYWWRGWI